MIHIWPIIVVVIVSILIIALLLTVILYRRKIQITQLEHIQRMIDEANSGTFVETEYKETRLSEIETSMWHYLSNSNLFKSQMNEHKVRIQTLISDISHQTVTPIANIKIYTELLEERIHSLEKENFYNFDNKNMVQEITCIKKQVEKLDFLIQSLVKVSRLENGIISLDVGDNSISETLESIKEQYSIKARSKNVDLIIESSSERALFDTKWTLEAIGNIVDNALKYTAEGGSVRIHVENYQLFLRIDVIDNGIGIEEKEIPKIFQRFYRSHAVSREKGVGIGLYLAKEILRQEQGYIKVASVIGKGSTFSMFLKRADNYRI